MKIDRTRLDNILRNNVCDIRFVRRNPKKGMAGTRRMLCTKCLDLLNSTNGRISLNYRPPSHSPLINEAAENLLIVWDVFMQDFRNINMNDCYLLKQIPADDTFWKYFNENLYTMSPDDKLNFMNS
jgi:hypothetical protein